MLLVCSLLCPLPLFQFRKTMLLILPLHVGLDRSNGTVHARGDHTTIADLVVIIDVRDLGLGRPATSLFVFNQEAPIAALGQQDGDVTLTCHSPHSGRQGRSYGTLPTLAAKAPRLAYTQA